MEVLKDLRSFAYGLNSVPEPTLRESLGWPYGADHRLLSAIDDRMARGRESWQIRVP